MRRSSNNSEQYIRTSNRPGKIDLRFRSGATLEHSFIAIGFNDVGQTVTIVPTRSKAITIPFSALEYFVIEEDVEKNETSVEKTGNNVD